jgi:hypothetical protein
MVDSEYKYKEQRYKDFGPYRLFFGLNWIYCEDKSIYKEEKAHLRAPKKNIVEYRIGGKVWVGFWDDNLELSNNLVNVPAAILASHLFSSAVIFERIDDKNGWLCIISNDAPLVEYDVIGDYDTLRAQAKEYAINNGVDIIGEDFGGAVSSFYNILESTDREIKFEKKEIFHTNIALIKKGIYTVLGFVFLSFLYISYNYYEEYKINKKREQDELAKKFLEEQLERERIKLLNEETRKKVDEFKRNVSKEIERIKNPNNSDAEALFQRWMDVVLGTSGTVFGCSLSSVICRVDICDVLWNRNQVFGGGQGNLENIQGLLDANFAEKNMTVDNKKQLSQPNEYISYSNISQRISLPQFVFSKGVYRSEQYKMRDVFSVFGRVSTLKIGMTMSLGNFQPVVVAGVPEHNIPDQVIGEQLEFSIMLTGGALFDKLNIIKDITSGFPIEWEEAKFLFSGKKMENISLRGRFLYLK